MGQVRHIVRGQPGVDSDGSIFRKIETAAHLLFRQWLDQIRACSDREEMNWRGETLLSAFLKGAIDDGERIGAPPHPVFQQMISPAEESAGEAAPFAGNPFESPEICPIENARCAMTAGEKQSRKEHGRAMIETMDKITTIPLQSIEPIEQIKRAQTTFPGAPRQRIESFDHFNAIEERPARARAVARPREERHRMSLFDQIAP